MSDMWELASYVEEHPGDYPQRWQLAKKLYAAHEYRLALEHLLVLKNEWKPHLNSRRYLGAVYYRMGRYTEAAKTLREAIREWPEEIGLREQLAHALTRGEEHKEALNVWEDVLQLQPDHIRAQKHIKKIRILLKTTLRSPYLSDADDDGVYDSAAGLPPEPPVVGNICPKCGAQNSEEFDRCWKCDASLALHEDSFLNLPSVQAHGPYLLRPETISSVAMFASFALFLVAIYFAVRLILTYKADSVEALTNVSQIYDQVLAPSRIMMSLVLLLWWPYALKLSLRLARIKAMPPAILIYISGLFLSSLTAVLVLMPHSMVFVAFLATLLISLLLVLLAFQIPPGSALVAWAAHIVLVWLMAACSFWFAECYRFGEFLNPLQELPVLQETMSGQGALQNAAPVRVPGFMTPIRQKVRWESSGSAWLDHYAHAARASVKKETAEQGLVFQILKGGNLIAHEPLEAEHLYVPFSIEPGEEYEFVVTGPDYAMVQIIVQSILPCVFVPSAPPAVSADGAPAEAANEGTTATTEQGAGTLTAPPSVRP